MNSLAYRASLLIAVFGVWHGAAGAQPFGPAGSPHSPPFTATLSNNTPLAFGMDAEDTSRALGTPLNYVSGRPGNEIFLAFRNVGGSGLFFLKDPAFLQFPKGRLGG